jgi:hypothetical protein
MSYHCAIHTRLESSACQFIVPPGPWRRPRRIDIAVDRARKFQEFLGENTWPGGDLSQNQVLSVVALQHRLLASVEVISRRTTIRQTHRALPWTNATTPASIHHKSDASS